jgi:hypothetical protein
VSGPANPSSISISSGLLDPFWEQLYKNIGRSELWNTFVVVEPVAAFFGRGDTVRTIELLDPLVCTDDRGTHAAQYFDEGIDSDREQFVGPRQEYTLLSSECPPRDWEDPSPLSMFLEHLKGDPNRASRLIGVLHYHADRPILSSDDFATMERFAAGVRELGGPPQVGMVVSERQPLDSFALRMAAPADEFVRHMRDKLGSRQIDMTASLFGGLGVGQSPIRVELIP